MPKGPDGKETGWLSKQAFHEKALAADDVGRQAMDDKYIIMRMLDDDITAQLAKVDELEKRLEALVRKIKEKSDGE